MRKPTLLFFLFVIIIAVGIWYYAAYRISHEFIGVMNVSQSSLYLNHGTIMADGGYATSANSSPLHLSGNKVSILYDEQTMIVREITNVSRTMSLGGSKTTVTQVNGVQFAKDLQTLVRTVVINAKSHENIYGKKEFRADEIHYYLQVIK